jgi:hypothetical protein
MLNSFAVSFITKCSSAAVIRLALNSRKGIADLQVSTQKHTFSTLLHNIQFSRHTVPSSRQETNITSLRIQLFSNFATS